MSSNVGINVRTDYRSDAQAGAGTSNDNYNAPFSPDLLAAVGFPGFGNPGAPLRLVLMAAAAFAVVYFLKSKR